VYFYVFLNFLQFSKIINKNKKSENRRTMLGWHFNPRPSVVGLSHEPFWPTGALGRRGALWSLGHHAQRAWWRARRQPGGDRSVTKSYPRAPWGLRGGAMQGEVAWFSPEMAGEGGVKKRSGEAALLWQRGSSSGQRGRRRGPAAGGDRG
jgi:hypothetical protein